MTPPAKNGEPAKAAASAFMTLDDRIPASVRALLLEADGCVASGFSTGATACAHQALESILKMEKAEGATQDARIRALGHDAETAAAHAARIGDTPELDEAGFTVVRNEQGERVARLDLGD